MWKSENAKDSIYINLKRYQDAIWNIAVSSALSTSFLKVKKKSVMENQKNMMWNANWIDNIHNNLYYVFSEQNLHFP